MITTFRAVALAALMTFVAVPRATAQQPDDEAPAETSERPSPLDDAHELFYSGRFEDAAALALEIRLSDPGNLEASELRTSALHFQIRRALGEPRDRGKAWKACGICQQLMPVFLEELAVGQAEARARLMKNPVDDEAQFFLGKLDLSYIWLQLATIGRKTGWKEYWEARRSLDAVLKRRPDHIRARVARAWIDYIVDTKLPFGTAWILGGGNKNRGLAVVREAAVADADRFVQAEAMFALWDMQVREKNFSEAVVTARALSEDFPENAELIKFVSTHDRPASR